MKKITLSLLFLLFLISCETNDEVDNEIIDVIGPAGSIPCNFQGRTYITKSIVLDVSFDLNGDGIYSNDIIQESGCYTSQITFDNDDKVPPIMSDLPRPEVITDSNGNLVQNVLCTTGDGTKSQCYRDGDEMILVFNGNISYTGIISENGTVLTFELPNWGYFMSFVVLNPDGTVTNYEGGAIVTFELQ